MSISPKIEKMKFFKTCVKKLNISEKSIFPDYNLQIYTSCKLQWYLLQNPTKSKHLMYNWRYSLFS